MCKEFILNNSSLELVISEQGGSVTRLTYLPKELEVLRQSISSSFSGDSSMFPMIPFANRIANNSFILNGDKINFPLHPYNDRYFIHGDGWLKNWEIRTDISDGNKLTLELNSNIKSVCQYKSLLSYELNDNSLIFTASIKNMGQSDFPFGCGFHPFFSIFKGSKLFYEADGVWLEDIDNLPIDYLKIIPDSLYFGDEKFIPDRWINNCYKVSKPMKVRLIHPNSSLVELESDCGYMQVYKPKGKSGFICLEPQSHFCNAHNSKNYKSLNLLSRGEEMKITNRITVTSL